LEGKRISWIEEGEVLESDLSFDLDKSPELEEESIWEELAFVLEVGWSCEDRNMSRLSNQVSAWGR
jgi:hypothetical protein